ncbi:MAG TPA: RHS repeat-associated core domain-containing protein [Candidatus Sulfotelmatobacter sp.]
MAGPCRSGKILAETDAAGNTQNEYIFFGGKRVAMVPATGSALYYAEDLLGSSRVIVQSNGTLCYDADFTPFGAERAYTTSCAQNYKFEGKERDTETQNDDFGARYYSSRLGRWLSSDWSAVPVPVPYANLTNPQTLNLYAMVADDPESFGDLDGHGDTTAAPNGGLTPDGQVNDCAHDQQMCGAQQQNQNTQGQAQNANTMPFPVAPELPALGKIVTTALDAVAGAVTSTTVAVAGAFAYLVGPGTSNVCTCSTDQPQAKTSGGPKAADAPGVTAGGQATDVHGNKRGPSGKPQVNETNSNTREGARNRTLGQGSGAVEHTNPAVGKPHFHPTDREGNKKPNSTHNNYPED